MTKKEMQGEINACKSLLADSDYKILKSLEQLVGCTSIVEVIDCIKGIGETAMEISRKRQQWRDTINTMEEQLDALNDTDDEEEYI